MKILKYLSIPVCLVMLLTACSTSTSSSPSTKGASNGKQYKIGFANLTEEGAFFVSVRKGMEKAAKQHGVQLVEADNRLDGATGLANAQNFVTQHVDLAVDFQTDEKVAPAIMDKFSQAKIPVIAVDIPMPGATFFGADNHQAGFLAGQYLGEKAKKDWNGQIDKVVMLELPQSGDIPAKRMKGELDGLKSVIPNIKSSDVIHLDSKGTREEAKSLISDVLTSIPNAHHIAILSINDDTALGAVAGLEVANRGKDAFVVGQGADPSGLQELQKDNSPYIGSTAYFPEKYGEYVISAALKILKGEKAPKQILMKHVFVSKDNVKTFVKQ